MSKEAKINRKDILPQIEQIKAKSEELAALVEALPECYVKEAYANSISNLRKKNDNFLTFSERRGLTPEEKAVIEAMRSGKKVEVSEISSVESTTESPKKSRKH